MINRVCFDCHHRGASHCNHPSDSLEEEVETLKEQVAELTEKKERYQAQLKKVRDAMQIVVDEMLDGAIVMFLTKRIQEIDELDK